MFIIRSKQKQFYQFSFHLFLNRLSASALCNIIDMCSDAKDKADPGWQTVNAALQKLGREEAAGVPAKPQVLADVAQKAVAIGQPAIAAVSCCFCGSTVLHY